MSSNSKLNVLPTAHGQSWTNRNLNWRYTLKEVLICSAWLDSFFPPKEWYYKKKVPILWNSKQPWPDTAHLSSNSSALALELTSPKPEMLLIKMPGSLPSEAALFSLLHVAPVISEHEGGYCLNGWKAASDPGTHKCCPVPNICWQVTLGKIMPALMQFFQDKFQEQLLIWFGRRHFLTKDTESPISVAQAIPIPGMYFFLHLT